MSVFSVKCPNCGFVFEAEKSLVGTQEVCLKCGGRLTLQPAHANIKFSEESPHVETNSAREKNGGLNLLWLEASLKFTKRSNLLFILIYLPSML